MTAVIAEADGVPATAAAASGDGRFAFFDADRADPAPDEPPFEPWLEAMRKRHLAVAWNAPAPGPRRLRVRWADATDPAGSAEDWQRLELPSGRLCIAGLDEAFAARNAELHPGAFGEIVEIEPGAYEVRVEPPPPATDSAAGDPEACRTRMLRPGDEFVTRLVQWGLPLVLVLMVVVAAAVVGALIWIGGKGGPAMVAAGAGGVLAAALAGWAILVRIGAIPPLRRVGEVRRAFAEAHPDAVLVLRSVSAMSAASAGGDPAGGPSASVDTTNPTGSRSPGLGISSTHRTLPPVGPA